MSCHLTPDGFYKLPPSMNIADQKFWFRVAEIPNKSVYQFHSHPWGEFVYCYDGLMEVKLENEHVMAPAQQGIWLPPSLRHEALNRHETTHCSFYLRNDACEGMPDWPCTLTINNVTRAMLAHLRKYPIPAHPTPEHLRFFEVLADQLKAAQTNKNFLPYSNDPILMNALKQIEDHISSDIPMNELMSNIGASARTLNRRSQELLGMSLGEWKKRLKIVKSMQLLEKGEKVEVVAFEMGYSSASAFIAMFHRVTGTTPREAINR